MRSSEDLEDANIPLLGSPIAIEPEERGAIQVFPLLQRIRKDIEESIDAALSWTQLNAPDVNFAIVRPLVFKYEQLNNSAIIYCFLLVRWHFVTLSESDLAYAGVNSSRAALCELLATKLVRGLSHRPMELASALTASWSVLQGASVPALAQIGLAVGGKPQELEEPMNALEMGIFSQAKFFMSSPLVQGVVNEIWSGRVLYSSSSDRSLVADNYKTRFIQIYDARVAPFLDHYRLRVPRYRALLEFLNYVLLLGLLCLCLANRNLQHINIYEAIFVIFAFGMVLDEYASSQEHGWKIYAANMWNTFDLTWVLMFLVYVGFRVRSLWLHDDQAADTAFDVLACSCVVLFPRVAFFLVANSVIILALRSMIKEYVFFISICMICFSGLLFTLWRLGDHKWRLSQIAWLMVQVWFGNTFLSFSQAESFHPIIGPVLMVIFAASVGLISTILISILSNTFARLNEYATEEFLFQFAISTLEGVKSDALFSYQPPFNLLAYFVLWPLSHLLSPRALHTINVFLIRVTALHILVTIAVYERYFAPRSSFLESRRTSGWKNVFLPRHFKKIAFVEAFIGSNNNDLLKAVFQVVAPPGEVISSDDEEDDHPEDIPIIRVPSPNPETPKSPTFPLQPSAPFPSLLRTPSTRSPSPAPDRGRRRVPSQTGTAYSPLAKLFNRGSSVESDDRRGVLDANALIEASKRMERTVEAMRVLPVTKLADEVRELQERQARIESLLLSLTRGMRGEGRGSKG
ncbi:hypothetical protein DACRYDRAFT_66519 [Dacryopinax primogenitus]|uniref:Receptor-activated Ca2+-permeable cation channel n=1 Tax=Dacryopinax primogenitus (strain DJM 731) TaxID=1858805 RepID=M5GDH7_DACPD|nr:uncharacterized protein DACRYDRAFT_66519 [Dacryopinax primogenitus]EJU02408.1 hypothetical protein DACRYDRAFT_66519 [Dacryopinax primogenitus]